MTIQTESEVGNPHLSRDLLLTSPSRTPVSEMGRTAWALYRLKWAFGYRLIGPASWTRKIRLRLSFERWVATHVKGWVSFFLWRIGIRVPFTSTVSGQTYHVRSASDRSEFSKRVRSAFQPPLFEEVVLGDQKGVFRFRFKERDLEFAYDGDRFGTMIVLREFFILEPYSGLEVEGKDVVDIGSSIGDTPIYFALNGAHRVIAFEPYPATHARAKLNITANGCDDKVTLLNEGAGVSGWMRLTREERNLWANAVPSSDGEDVRFNSLRDIISRFGIENGVLKFHGEGSEYEFLLHASTEDLARFSQIALKYHYGSKPIIKKLNSAGFTISRKWDLHFSYNSSSSSPKYEAGLIIAKRTRGVLGTTGSTEGPDLFLT